MTKIKYSKHEVYAKNENKTQKHISVSKWKSVTSAFRILRVICSISEVKLNKIKLNLEHCLPF